MCKQLKFIVARYVRGRVGRQGYSIAVVDMSDDGGQEVDDCEILTRKYKSGLYSVSQMNALTASELADRLQIHISPHAEHRDGEWYYYRVLETDDEETAPEE